MPGFNLTDLIRQISQWPLWKKLTAAAGLIFLALLGKILEDPVLALRDWVGDFLAKQHSHFGWQLLGIGVVAR